MENYTYFVDTPGLNDPDVTNASILEEIAKLLEMTKNSVTYAGVLYVHPATLQYSRETKESLQFLNVFCGPSYFPSVTFVTTFWDRVASARLEEQDKLVSQLANSKWASFLDRGANIYHHGRVYDGEKPTLCTLSLDNHPQLRQTQARDMIAHLYPLDKIYDAPLIIKELQMRVTLEDTRFSAIVEAIKFPFDKVTTFLTALWELANRLKATIMKMVPGSIIRVSLPYLNGHRVEVLFTLPGGFGFVVGYGASGPYMGPYQSQGPRFNSNRAWDNGASDDSEVDSPQQEEPEGVWSGRVFEMEEANPSPEYRAIRHIFEGIASTQNEASPLNPADQPWQDITREETSREDTPDDDLWWWQRCVMM
ncbi:uncharacterized protein N7482_007720 [Penicillium canariense]|uniref:G domain-containing protein n=1 Tax=Penicillium canariense TaxID=189055 RepID=A0A9W9HZZ1_9EURO|nr:uncharacterized protein N7482_007720 [Penicillium canariense]KAJ5160716.1 hypothetical protein N7482_007720 [Penicillium canariense]